MSEFNALLTRAFAEADVPADNGFSVSVARGVAGRERARRLRGAAQAVGLGIAALTLALAAFNPVSIMIQEWLGSAGLGAARAYGAIDANGLAVQAESAGGAALRSLGLGLTQILLIAGALVGGAVAYRAAQD
jgi:hypothetical protein